MKQLMKILLGLTIGVGIAILFAPKSGRKLREQLIGGATGKLLPAAPVEFPEPEGERLWDAGTVTAVAEPPVAEPVFEEPAIVEEAAVAEEEAVAEAAAVEPEVVDEVTVAEPEVAEVVDEVTVAEPEVAEEATSEDLRAHIEETRAAVETDIAQPFASTAVEDAVAEEAVVEEVAVEETVAEEAVVDEAVAEEAVVEESAEEAAAETPASEAPVVEEAPVREAVEGLIADMTSGPVAEAAAEPVAEEEPVAREGGTIDQAEMRRRIEETRARLKAKAFDAMMSGEAALLSRDSGEKPVPKGDDVKLDGELESTIDESLSQEEY